MRAYLINALFSSVTSLVSLKNSILKRYQTWQGSTLEGGSSPLQGQYPIGYCAAPHEVLLPPSQSYPSRVCFSSCSLTSTLCLMICLHRVEVSEQELKLILWWREHCFSWTYGSRNSTFIVYVYGTRNINIDDEGWIGNSVRKEEERYPEAHQHSSHL